MSDQRCFRAAVALMLALACAVPWGTIARAQEPPPPPPPDGQATPPPGEEKPQPPEPQQPTPAPVAPGAAQIPASSRVTGRVVAADGKTPLVGAVVSAYPLSKGPVVTSSPTGQKGEYELTSVPYGYMDMTVKTTEGIFVSNEVVSVPPNAKQVVNFVLTRYDALPQAWWSGRQKRDAPGGQPSVGIAEIHHSGSGRTAFWKSPKGLGIMAGAAAVAIVAIASSGGKESSASPSSP